MGIVLTGIVRIRIGVGIGIATAQGIRYAFHYRGLATARGGVGGGAGRRGGRRRRG